MRSETLLVAYTVSWRAVAEEDIHSNGVWNHASAFPCGQEVWEGGHGLVDRYPMQPVARHLSNAGMFQGRKERQGMASQTALANVEGYPSIIDTAH